MNTSLTHKEKCYTFCNWDHIDGIHAKFWLIPEVSLWFVKNLVYQLWRRNDIDRLTVNKKKTKNKLIFVLMFKVSTLVWIMWIQVRLNLCSRQNSFLESITFQRARFCKFNPVKSVFLMSLKVTKWVPLKRFLRFVIKSDIKSVLDV